MIVVERKPHDSCVTGKSGGNTMGLQYRDGSTWLRLSSPTQWNGGGDVAATEGEEKEEEAAVKLDDDDDDDDPSPPSAPPLFDVQKVEGIDGE
jgi:hypothetical protein